MDNHPTINNIFTDENELFDDTNLKTEDKTMYREIYYIREIVIREVRTIMNVTENNVPQTSQRGPSLNLRYEDVIFQTLTLKLKLIKCLMLKLLIIFQILRLQTNDLYILGNC